VAREVAELRIGNRVVHAVLEGTSVAAVVQCIEVAHVRQSTTLYELLRAVEHQYAVACIVQAHLLAVTVCMLKHAVG
jgi:hypothetical protein